MPMKWMANQIKSKQQEKEQKNPQRKILVRGTPEFIEREQKMLEMFDEGLTIDVIAERLGLTSGTIRHHVEYARGKGARSEEHTSELQSRGHLVCRLLLEKKK